MAAKECGTCSMCCKLLYIEELAKPPGQWCPHVVQGKGCGIYETRPRPCRAFSCHWIKLEALDDRWRPDRCGFLLWWVSETVLMVVVEPTKPDAWKRQPFYGQLKEWSKTALTGVGMVVVKVRNNATVLLPHRDVFVGDVGTDDKVSVGFDKTGLQRRVWVNVRREDGSVRRFDAGHVAG